ncbi:MAG TPA: hypothetical protein VKV26_00830 [Dehalococcoidia bacterium]|nr:hypothetical protein [Dehalococcoidia bacterium]
MTAFAETPPRHDEPATALQIVNPVPRYARVPLVEPTVSGYIHIAAQVQPRSLPFLPNGREKTALLTNLRPLARRLQRLDAVHEITGFDAIASPPFGRLPYIREHPDEIHLARFDVVLLIETASPAAALALQQSAEYLAVLDTLRRESRDLHVMAARNAKRIGDVDHRRRDTFLFNHFVADDEAVMLELWDHLAAWYAAETGLDNSVLLVPLADQRSDYLAVNHASWHEGLARVLWRQFARSSFWSYVQANLTANHVGAMPVLYRRTFRTADAAT